MMRASPVGSAVTVLALVFSTAVAHASPSLEGDFLREVREAGQLARLGRALEAQALYEALANRIPRLAEGTRQLLGEQVARGLDTIGDARLAAKVREAAGFDRSDPAGWIEGLSKLWQDRQTDEGLRKLACMEALERLQGLRDPTPRQLVLRARCLVAVGQTVAARQDLVLASSRDPRSPDPDLVLARLALKDGDPDSGHDHAMAAAGKGAPDASLTAQDAWAALEVRGQGDRALDLSTAWVQRFGPDGLPAGRCAAVGQGLMRAGKPVEAFQSLARAASLERTDSLIEAAVRAGAVRANRNEGDRREVAAVVKALVAPDPSSPPALLKTAGDCLVLGDQLLDAVIYYRAGASTADARTFQQPLADARAKLAKRFAAAAGPAEDRVLSNPEDEMLLLIRSTELARGVLEAERIGAGQGTEVALASAASLVPALAGVATGAGFDEKLLQPGPVDANRVAGHWHGGPRERLIQAYLSGDTEVPQLMFASALGITAPTPGDGPLGNLGFALRTPSRDDVPSKIVRRALVTVSSPESPPERKLARVLEAGSYVQASPILIDVDGPGTPNLTPAENPAGSVWFDLGGLGSPQRVQWSTGGRQAWLCEDLDGDGRITSGHELFGTADGHVNGYAKLASRDRSGDGVVAGSELAGLSMWTDRNGDGQTDPGELATVDSAGLQAVFLPRTGLESTVTLHGETRRCWDVWPRVFELHR